MQTDIQGGFFPPLPFPEEMRQWDQWAVQAGFIEEMLMENAGRCAFYTLQHYFKALGHKNIVLLMGGGNNGGDAACLARYVKEAGAQVLVFHTHALDSYGGAAKYHIKLAKNDGVKFVSLEPPLKTALGQLPWMPDIVVDGLLGTGFSGTLRQETNLIVEQVNEFARNCHAFVLALDVPSGLDAKTGRPSPVSIKANATVSFAAAKSGLLMPGAQYWTGQIHVGNIGLPVRQKLGNSSSVFLIDSHCLGLLPPPPANAYKNGFGHVLIIGGADRYAGAAHLAALGALRIGAGLVSTISPAANASELRTAQPEIMTIGIGDHASRQWPGILPDALQDLLEGSASLVIGPGFGRDASALKFLELIISHKLRPPTVLDADALSLLARKPALFRHVRATDILTPHPGEAASMLGIGNAAVQADRLSALSKLQSLSGAIVVLKGAGSLVSNGKHILLCPYDAPQLSVGGSGDILAGIIGGLLGQKPLGQIGEFLLAGIGVGVHALAGIELGKKYGMRGNLASEIAGAVPLVLDKFANSSKTPMSVNIVPWPQ